MKCAVHAEVDAIGYCRNCGRALCAQCQRDVRGALYCEDCLATKVFAAPAASLVPGSAPATVAAAPQANKPGVALALGFIPGLGAVYNGEYLKALVHVLIFGSLIAGQNSEMPGGLHALLGLVIACFYFYMPIDAYRVAKAREAGVAGNQTMPEPFPIPDPQTRRATFALVLIGVGVFLLLTNLGLLNWDWFDKIWPAGLIALGVWILITRMQRSGP